MQWSDAEVSDEEGLPVLWATVAPQQFPFGKYKGSTYEEMIQRKRSRNYLRYILTWDKLRNHTKLKIECALDEFKRLVQARE
jgi:hypothetical protein